MIDPNLVKIFAIIVGSGAIGSLLALAPLFLKKETGASGYGTTAGVGFLIGASLGGLFGIFAVLLGQI